MMRFTLALLLFSITKLNAQEIKETEEIFNLVEVMPEPPGGIKEFYKFIGKNIKYPKTIIGDTAFKDCKVYIKFIIDEEGTLVSPKVIKGCPGYLECDLEALRVIELCAKWKPGTQNNKPVKVYFTMPFSFKTK